MKQLGKELAHPKGIVVVSAHWQTSGTQVTSSERPKQIFDFHGFPRALSEVKYLPAGSPQLADRIHQVNTSIATTLNWGLDHGAWTVLSHMYPSQNIPVVQLSLDRTLTPQQHFTLAKSLRSLRSDDILILGSGNIIHNLGEIEWDENAPPTPWANQFENDFIALACKEGLSASDKLDQIVALKNFRKAHPTPEHFLPFVYILGLADDSKPLKKMISGIQNSSISMATFST